MGCNSSPQRMIIRTPSRNCAAFCKVVRIFSHVGPSVLESFCRGEVVRMSLSLRLNARAKKIDR